MKMHLPNTIKSPISDGGHVQGIAVDAKGGFVYWSFTTQLLKTDLSGTLIGSVKNLVGHLGCITYDAENDAVYGSLELKHDVIGKGIVSRTGKALAEEDAFYLVAFDCAKINRENMDAEADGVMLAVYLRDVVQDYLATDEVSGKSHRYGCSGIDGVALGPVFGSGNAAKKKIMVAYGIYSDVERDDNDHQILLQLDRSVFSQYGTPLQQSAPHHAGPGACEQRYFFYTGNTTFGVQNLEYDPWTEIWWVSVYCGKKKNFPNFSTFMIDGAHAPENLPLDGRCGEYGLSLFSAAVGQTCKDARIRGTTFPLGATGIAALGDGSFYFSKHFSDWEKGEFSSTLFKYRYASEQETLFARVEE